MVVASGQTITYSRLSAGCLAVTVFFAGGGGAGVHLAMMPEKGEQQWTDFLSAIRGKTIDAVHLDVDAWGGDQGWRVNTTSDVPKSTAELVNTWDLKLGELVGNGWKHEMKDVRAWFATKLGKSPGMHDNQTPEYTVP